ncbi:MAG: C40 family peptidase [Campylobacteraceae bacterium]|jgi:cell wall-associated NlpC family hydrolase|nr:C40 family peptidase [Campylobacteraceae bacterium]
MNRFLMMLSVAVLLTACAGKSLSKEFGFTIDKSDNQALYSASSQWLGTPYKIGGTTQKGVDCSGFVNAIYKEVYDRSLERNSADIYLKSDKIAKSDLREGDFVFFRTNNSKSVNHIGIYLKNGYFVHASTSKGVMVNKLNEKYYQNSFVSGGRAK